MKESSLKIKNLGPINEANINIGKINVMAGKNGSGKTTVNKLLYSILTSASSDKEFLVCENIKKN